MQEKLRIYEVWQDDKDHSTTMTTGQGVQELRRKGLLSSEAKLIHVITAATYEEAKSIFNLRMGFGPYHPEGQPRCCPNGCGAFFYPDSTGECPYCGPIL